MRRRRWPWIVLVGALGIGAWIASHFIVLPITVSEGYKGFGSPRNLPASNVGKDDQTGLCLHPSTPWRIELGRGSGWHGLNTIKIDQDGRVAFHRLRSDRRDDGILLSWETATAKMRQEDVAKVLDAVGANRLLDLDKAYHADVCDGTQ